MVKKGDIITLSLDINNKSKSYLISDRLNDMEQGQGGWLCVDIEALHEKGIDNISHFDCWRITDKYLNMQIQRGIIKINN